MSIPIKISGSRSAAILGMSPYQTPVEIWLTIQEEINPGFCEKHDYEKPEFKSNHAMSWGTGFEDVLTKKVEQIKNIEIINREKIFIKDDFLSCHIDGEIKGEEILIENKTTSEYYFKDNYGEENSDAIPMQYQIQVQHNMMLTGFKKCLMPVLIFSKRPDDYENAGISLFEINKELWIDALSEMGNIKFFEILPHPELQSLMISAYTEFWNENILGQKPPEPKTYDDIRKLIRNPVGTIIADENIERMLLEKKEISKEISATGSLARRIDQIKTDVLNWSNQTHKIIDDDTTDKWIIKSRDGKKLGQYSKDKNGILIFR